MLHPKAMEAIPDQTTVVFDSEYHLPQRSCEEESRLDPELEIFVDRG